MSLIGTERNPVVHGGSAYHLLSANQYSFSPAATHYDARNAAALAGRVHAPADLPIPSVAMAALSAAGDPRGGFYDSQTLLRIAAIDADKRDLDGPRRAARDVSDDSLSSGSGSMVAAAERAAGIPIPSISTEIPDEFVSPDLQEHKKLSCRVDQAPTAKFSKREKTSIRKIAQQIADVTSIDKAEAVKLAKILVHAKGYKGKVYKKDSKMPFTLVLDEGIAFVHTKTILGGGASKTADVALRIDLENSEVTKIARTKAAGSTALSAAREAHHLSSLGNSDLYPVVHAVFQTTGKSLRPTTTVYQELCTPLDQVQNLTYYQKLVLARDYAAGIAHLHAQGFVHNDVKAGNLLVQSDGGGKVTDLGIANPIGTAPEIGLNRTLLAPEQFTNPEARLSIPLTEAIDVYQFGLTLIDMFAPPYEKGLSEEQEAADFQLFLDSQRFTKETITTDHQAKLFRRFRNWYTKEGELVEVKQLIKKCLTGIPERYLNPASKVSKGDREPDPDRMDPEVLQTRPKMAEIKREFALMINKVETTPFYARHLGYEPPAIATPRRRFERLRRPMRRQSAAATLPRPPESTGSPGTSGSTDSSGSTESTGSSGSPRSAGSAGGLAGAVSRAAKRVLDRRASD